MENQQSSLKQLVAMTFIVLTLCVILFIIGGIALTAKSMNFNRILANVVDIHGFEIDYQIDVAGIQEAMQTNENSMKVYSLLASGKSVDKMMSGTFIVEFDSIFDARHDTYAALMTENGQELEIGIIKIGDYMYTSGPLYVDPETGERYWIDAYVVQEMLKILVEPSKVNRAFTKREQREMLKTLVENVDITFETKTLFTMKDGELVTVLRVNVDEGSLLESMNTLPDEAVNLRTVIELLALMDEGEITVGLLDGEVKQLASEYVTAEIAYLAVKGKVQKPENILFDRDATVDEVIVDSYKKQQLEMKLDEQNRMWEEEYAPIDSDRDGLNDVEEAKYGTDPNKPDTDGDGYTDGHEVKNGYNPLGAGKWQNTSNGIEIRFD